ncbi:MAG: hypothetical protein M3P51_04740, partial [Chloroflexota bacterium]|nr:hypothetical protein [Chloroflexota bacterium]
MQAWIGPIALAGLILVVIRVATQVIQERSEATALGTTQQLTRVPYDYGLDGTDPELQKALEDNRKRYMPPPLSKPAISMQ